MTDGGTAEARRNTVRRATMFAALGLLIFVLLCTPALLSFSYCPADALGSDAPMTAHANLAQDTVPPVADAGEDFTTYVGMTTVLNGSASLDDVTIASYVWTFEDDGTRTLTGAVVTYVFTVPGVYDVTLNVTDLEGNWDTDTVTVTVLIDTTPPVVFPGYNITSYAGRPMVFDGSRSYDRETGIVNYTWNFTYAGQEVRLYGPVASFTFVQTGDYLVTLTVTNGAGMTASGSLTITIEKRPTWLLAYSKGLTVGLVVLGIVSVWAYRKWQRDHTLLTKSDKEKLQLKWKDAKRIWRLFRGNRLGFSGFLILCVFGAMAIFAPWLSTVQDPNLTQNHEPIQPDWDNPARPSLTPSKYTGFLHPLGTDSVGQDVYSMTLYGARASLLVGFVAAFISIAVGVSIGLASGYFGKFADEALMRFTDYFLVLPWFPLMIVLMTVLGQKFHFVILVIGLTSWPSTARIVRSQVLTVKERSFIERAKAIGAGDAHIIQRHVFPNVLPLVFANMVLLISLAIFSEAYLDFFGLGDPDVISWGTMLEAAYGFGAFDSGAWWWILPPSISIIVCVLAFSLVGYALDDIFNPKLRKR